MLIEKIIFEDKNDIFPQNLPFFGKTLSFQKGITFFVGENGSGKSTLLELMALKLNLIRIYRSEKAYDILSSSIKNALGACKIHYTTKPKGIFFGAEDFTTYIHSLEEEKALARLELDRIENEYRHRSAFAKGQARMPYARTLHEIDELYEKDLLIQSHGEAYLDFFKSRIRDHQLYFLDEPETPLSIQNQFALMLIIKDAIKRGCQFLIATHSPILTSYPDAQIYEFTGSDVEETTYDQLEFVQTMKDFLNHRERYINQLFDEDDQDV